MFPKALTEQGGFCRQSRIPRSPGNEDMGCPPGLVQPQRLTPTVTAGSRKPGSDRPSPPCPPAKRRARPAAGRSPKKGADSNCTIPVGPFPREYPICASRRLPFFLMRLVCTTTGVSIRRPDILRSPPARAPSADTARYRSPGRPPLPPACRPPPPARLYPRPRDRDR